MNMTHSKPIRLAFLAACSALWLTAAVHAQTPAIVDAFGEYDSGTSNQYVDVTFSEAMNPASVTNAANYSIAGHTISGAMLFTNNAGVSSTNLMILQLDSRLTGSFTLNVNNVQSVSGTPIAANTSVAGTLDPLSSIDIGVFWETGTTYYEGPGSYLVNSSGQDFATSQDGIRFVWGTRTNNFAVVVQVPWILPGGYWSSVGLMAREIIDPSDGGSRDIAVYTTATAAQIGQDGNAGVDTLQMGVRDTTDQPFYQPADYIGDGAVRPDYPNVWLLLTRQTDGTNDLFTTYASTNEANWTWMGDLNPLTSGESNAFPRVVNVGMAAAADSYSPNTYVVTAAFQNFGDYVNHVFLTNSPQSVTVESGTSATFSVLAGSDGTVLRNGATYPLLGYQWYTNGVAVPGATADIYTTPITTTNLNGLQVYCAIISPIASASATNSATATLTVREDTVPPTIVSAFGEYDSGTSNQYVDVNFDKIMNVASLLNPADYSIAGYTISGVMLFTNDLGVGSGTVVILQLSKPLTGSFTLNVKNVQSISSIPIAANTAVAGTADPLASIDIGNFTVTGTTDYEGPGSYAVDASGNGIGNAQDGFRFVYGTRTNNFAVVVQVPSILPADTWSEAGLMARETIDPTDGGSRMIAVVTTATAAQIALDGGAGENSLSMEVRDTTGTNAYEPADYIGDGVIMPVYPNQWLLLTRQTDGTHDRFTAYGSTNEVNWTWMGEFNPATSGTSNAFPGVVNVGMCTTANIAPPGVDLATATYQNFGDYVSHVYLIDSPQSVTVEDGTSTTFSVLLGSDATVLRNGATNALAAYQWYTNDVAVPGATADIYTIPLTTTNLNRLQVYCAFSAVGSATASNSATATLTVVQGPPTIVGAFGEYDSGTSNQYVDLTFNKMMDVASLTNNPADYSIAGHPISGAVLFTNNAGVALTNMVILQLNSRLTGGCTLDVKNIQSFDGVPIAANTSVAGTLDPLSSIDIGVFWETGTTYYEGADSYLINSSGQDIWTTNDGFRFVYATRTNNFDVVVQVPWILPGGWWSDAGLMARETIDPSDGGSRMIAVYTTATAAQIGLDGNAGANTLQMSVRDTPDTAVYTPADYIGDGHVRPDYPNVWLRLTRQTDGTNDLFTAYASTDKVNWTFMGSLNPVTSGVGTPFPSVVNVGMAASADSYSPNTYVVTEAFQNFGDYVEQPRTTLTATLAATKQSLIISWKPAGESLYSSPVLGSAANWTLVTTNNPATVTITGPAMFFRIGP
jgi:hypothetical protein